MVVNLCSDWLDPLKLYGLTIVDPSGWAITNVARFSQLESYKLIWYYNDDDIGLEGDSVNSNSFIHTYDDSIKLQYGGNNTTQSNIIWQLFNGAGCRVAGRLCRRHGQ